MRWPVQQAAILGNKYRGQVSKLLCSPSRMCLDWFPKVTGSWTCQHISLELAPKYMKASMICTKDSSVKWAMDGVGACAGQAIQSHITNFQQSGTQRLARSSSNFQTCLLSILGQMKWINLTRTTASGWMMYHTSIMVRLFVAQPLLSMLQWMCCKHEHLSGCG